MWIQKLPGGGVTDLAFSRDGRSLYTLDTSGRITVWDVRTHAGLRIASEHLFRGRFTRGLHPLTEGRLLIRCEEFTVIDSDGKLTTHPGPPDLGNRFANVSDGGQIYYVDKSGQTIVMCELGNNTPEPAFSLEETSPIERIDRFNWSSDGRFLLTLSRWRGSTGFVDLFERTAAGQWHTLGQVKSVPQAYRAGFSPDGRTLIMFASQPERFALLDMASRTVRVRNVECSMPWGLFAFNPVYPLFAACLKDGTLAIWSLEDGRTALHDSLSLMGGRVVFVLLLGMLE